MSAGPISALIRNAAVADALVAQLIRSQLAHGRAVGRARAITESQALRLDHVGTSVTVFLGTAFSQAVFENTRLQFSAVLFAVFGHRNRQRW
jgi:hypothetical protein